jgi:hypothetical protein
MSVTVGMLCNQREAQLRMGETAVFADGKGRVKFADEREFTRGLMECRGGTSRGRSYKSVGGGQEVVGVFEGYGWR